MKRMIERGGRMDLRQAGIMTPVIIVAIVAIIAISSSSTRQTDQTNVIGQAITQGSTIPPGYAPPFDVWTGETFFAVESSKPDPDGLVTVTVTASRPGAWIHKRFYLSEGTGTDARWTPHSFAADKEGEWILGSATGSATITASKLDQENYALIYSCKPNDDAPGGYDCGCDDQYDSLCRHYAIQSYEGPATTAPHCSDGVKGGAETDVDCGGPCLPCDDGGECHLHMDCMSGSCVAGICVGDSPDPNPDPDSSLIGDLIISDSQVVFHMTGISTCGQSGPGEPFAAHEFLFSKETGTLFTADYLGMSAFSLNGLQPADAATRNFYTGASIGGTGTNCQTAQCLFDEMNPCALKLNENPNAFCIGVHGDCGGARTSLALLAGPSMAYVRTNPPYATHNSRLLFDGASSSFRLIGEFADPYLGIAGGHAIPVYSSGQINGRRAEGNGNEGVVYYGSGVANKPGTYVLFLQAGSELYGILSAQGGHSMVGDGPWTVMRLTDIDSPVTLGAPSPELQRVLEGLKGAQTLFATKMLFSEEKLFGLSDGETFTVYDWSDPTAVTVVDEFPDDLPATIDDPGYDGSSAGERAALVSSVSRDGDALYLTIPEDGAYRLYQHVIGESAGWTPLMALEGPVSFSVMDRPSVEVFDGKVFSVLRSQGWPYTGTLRVSALDGTLLLEEELDDHDAENHAETNSVTHGQSFAVTKQDGNYYLYRLHTAIGGVASDGETMLIGYEIGTQQTI